MKRSATLIFSLFLMCAGLKAQTFRVGLYGGVNVTDVDGADLTDNDNDFHKFGFNAGGLVSTHIGKKSILQMEIGYSQTGSSQPPDTLHTNAYYTMRLNYVNVVVAIRRQVHFILSKKPTDKFGIEGGFSAGYMFKSFYSYQSIVYPIDVNTTDISLFVGVAYNFTPRFCLDVRYYNSVIPVIKRDGSPTIPYPYYGDWNAGDNLVFQASFKYTFGNDASAIDSRPTPPAQN